MSKTSPYGALERRSADARADDLARALPEQIARARSLAGYGGTLADMSASDIRSVADLAALPVLRK